MHLTKQQAVDQLARIQVAIAKDKVGQGTVSMELMTERDRLVEVIATTDGDVGVKKRNSTSITVRNETNNLLSFVSGITNQSKSNYIANLAVADARARATAISDSKVRGTLIGMINSVLVDQEYLNIFNKTKGQIMTRSRQWQKDI